jgi:hypothetical protein
MYFELNFNFDFKWTRIKEKNDQNILNNQNKRNKYNDFKQKQTILTSIYVKTNKKTKHQFRFPPIPTLFKDNIKPSYSRC